jgi:hypothetical protein
MDEEYFIDDEITDLVAEMAKRDAGLTIALLCGLLTGVVESCADNQGHNPKAKVELVGSGRKITIDAGD